MGWRLFALMAGCEVEQEFTYHVGRTVEECGTFTLYYEASDQDEDGYTGTCDPVCQYMVDEATGQRQEVVEGDSGYSADWLEMDDCISDLPDCDDVNVNVNPGVAADLCNGIDDNCDNYTDEDEAVVLYADTDGDGYGDTEVTDLACDVTAGWSETPGDCDDADASIHPAADELCDEVDNDCDDEIDEGDPVDAPSWYVDVDGDGYGGDSAPQVSCDQPTGYVSDASDCDDGDAAVNPDAMETCNGEDDDCDGSVDWSDGLRCLSRADVTWSSSSSGAAVGQALLGTDVDADGIGDLVVGAPTERDPSSVQAGAVHVCYGADLAFTGAGIPATTADCGDHVYGGADGDHLGYQLGAYTESGALSALLVAAPYLDDGSVTDAGTVYVFEAAAVAGGQVDAVDDARTWFVGSQAQASFGDALALVEVEGSANLYVGASSDSVTGWYDGSVWTFNPEASSRGTSSDPFASSDTGRGNAGKALAVADMDGDGTDELLVGAYSAGSGTGPGRVYVVDHDSLSDDSVTLDDFDYLSGDATDDMFGAAIAVADLDGDPTTVELAVSAPGNDDAGSGAGTVYILAADVFAGQSGTEVGRVTHLASFQGDNGSYAGTALAAEEGVLLVGAWGYQSDTGAAYFLECVACDLDGSAHTLADVGGSSAGFRMEGEVVGDSAGFSVAFVPDMDGSGVSEVAVGAPFTVGGGAVYVVRR